MPLHKFPPKNYKMYDYPLPHEFAYDFFLAAENEAANSTYCTILRNNTDRSVQADAIEVNPTHASFAEETGATCCQESIVPKMRVAFTAEIPLVAYRQQHLGASATDDIDNIMFNWMPVYSSFAEPMNSINAEDGLGLDTVLGLTVFGTGKKLYPTFDNTKLLLPASSGTHPVNTVNDAEAFGDWGLDTDLTPENVAFDADIFFDNLKYGTNSSMMKKVTGKWNTVVLHHGRTYNFFSNNFTQPTVKRINEYTYCGILFHCPTVGVKSRQFNIAADMTATIPQVHIRMNVSYDEWNFQFDQTPA